MTSRRSTCSHGSTRTDPSAGVFTVADDGLHAERGPARWASTSCLRGVFYGCVASLAAAVLAAGCTGSAPGPAEIDTRNTACAHCGMVVSDRRTAAQVVAPGEEPVFFDDLGCLASWLKKRHALLAPESTIYVGDHRTRDWVPADRAVFTRVPGLETPMGSGIVAHATAKSRDEDRDAAGGVPVRAEEIVPRNTLVQP